MPNLGVVAYKAHASFRRDKRKLKTGERCDFTSRPKYQIENMELWKPYQLMSPDLCFSSRWSWQHLRFLGLTILTLHADPNNSCFCSPTFRSLWRCVFWGGSSTSHVEGFPLNQAALVQGLGRTMMQLIPQHFLLANGFFPFRGPTKFHPVEGWIALGKAYGNVYDKSLVGDP